MFPLKFVLIAALLVAYVGAEEDTTLIESKIVGGTAAAITSFPYQVSLRSGGSHFCGGSIYDNFTIITAAHCVKAIATPTNIVIYYGSANRLTGGKTVGVKAAKVHPNYNANTMINDIAILSTKAAIQLDGTSVKLIALAKQEPLNGADALISGWGTLQSGATTIPTTLMSAKVKIISRAACKASPYKYPAADILSTMICAGASGIDTCQGDSGGPLVSNKTLVGVVSWGNGCANQYYPGVYTSVPTLLSFIQTTAAALK